MVFKNLNKHFPFFSILIGFLADRKKFENVIYRWHSSIPRKNWNKWRFWTTHGSPIKICFLLPFYQRDFKLSWEFHRTCQFLVQESPLPRHQSWKIFQVTRIWILLILSWINVCFPFQNKQYANQYIACHFFHRKNAILVGTLCVEKCSVPVLDIISSFSPYGE